MVGEGAAGGVEFFLLGEDVADNISVRVSPNGNYTRYTALVLISLGLYKRGYPLLSLGRTSRYGT